MSIESWLEKRYGRVRTKEERKGELSFSGIDWYAAFHPPRQFPKGHVRAYDSDGIYTYKDQNPRYK